MHCRPFLNHIQHLHFFHNLRVVTEHKPCENWDLTVFQIVRETEIPAYCTSTSIKEALYYHLILTFLTAWQ